MSRKRGNQGSLFERNQDQDRPLSANEVARFLKRLSSFYRDPKTGNPALSEALAELSAGLSRGRGLSLADAVSATDVSSKQTASSDLALLKKFTLEEVKKLLSETVLTKTELIDLGAERFAIPRAGLKRVNRDQVSDAVWAAVQHEESIEIISLEAQRGGQERSS